MVKILCSIFFVFLTFNTVYPVFGELEFFPSTDKKEIEIDESFVYSIKISGENSPEFKIKEIPDFIITGEKTEYQGNSHFETIIDGKLIQSTAQPKSKIIYISLKPLKTGKLQIGPFNAMIDSSPKIIPPVKIFVKNSKKNNAPINSGSIQNAESVYIETKILSPFDITGDSENIFFINQPIAVDYKLYSNVNIQFLNNPEIPFFKGFQTESDFEYQTKTTANNANYNLYSIRKIVYPLIGGKLIIPGIKINALAHYDPYLGTGKRRILKSPDKQITVKTISADSGFSGILADSIYARFFTGGETIISGKPFTLFFQISGRFNLRYPLKIYLSHSYNFELLNTSDSASISCDSFGLRGSRLFKFTVLPKTVCSEIISIKPFSYYSASSNKIETIEPKIKIESKSNPDSQIASSINSESTYRNGVELKNISLKNSGGYLKVYIFLTIIIVTFVFGFAIFYIKNKKSLPVSSSINSKIVLSKFDFELDLNNPECSSKIFYDKIYDSLNYYFSEKFKINFAKKTEKRFFETFFKNKGIDSNASKFFSDMIEKWFLKRFQENDGFELNEMKNDFQELTRLYVILDELKSDNISDIK
ncbi:MAG TPA: BatD family protein [bacterium]|nr:BatD family protein [bacterium]HPN30523.1 BatD family protein [bacterium]